jgi:hypothetical protein
VTFLSYPRPAFFDSLDHFLYVTIAQPAAAHHLKEIPMEEHQDTAPEQTAPMPFTEKLTNIFASPGELFENVRLTGPTTANWLVPLLIFIVVAILMNQVMMHNASLADQFGAIIKKSMSEQVQQGKMTQEQADQAYETFARPGSMMNTIFTVGGIIIVTPIILFLVGLIYWLLGKTAMHASAPYMKVVEVVGLTFFIGVLESIVTTVMMLAMDSIHATPSLGAFVTQFDMQNKLDLILSKVNIFTFWSLSVTGIGLAKLFQRDLPKVLVLVFALWVLWTIVTVFAGIKFAG